MNQITQINPARFLMEMQSKLAGIKRTRAIYAPQLAPEFNAIGILWPGETALSNVLSILLNPHGEHGQGSVFLNGFFQHFKIFEKIHLDDSWSHYDQVRVQTEVVTDHYRRIDVVIKFDGDIRWAIGIENKPWAQDQHMQVAHYAEFLKKYYADNYCLIYLSGNGEGPSEYSTGGNEIENLFVIEYRDLRAWLQICAAKCQSYRVRFFLEELVSYISMEFTGIVDLKEQEMIADDILSSPDTIESAFLVSAAFDKAKEKLLNKLWDDCDRKFKNHGLLFERPKFDRPADSKYQPIKVRLAPGDKYSVCMEFARKNMEGCYFGVRKERCEYPDIPMIKEALGQKGKSSPWWVWWDWFDQARNWNQSSAWIDIHTGKMSDEIVNKFLFVYESMRSKDLLDFLR